jgi:hypothetical protein
MWGGGAGDKYVIVVALFFGLSNNTWCANLYVYLYYPNGDASTRNV